jgi:hypothetical protein
MNKRTFSLIFLVFFTVSLIFSVGCFGKKGSDAPVATIATPTNAAGNIVADSVAVTRSANDVVVTWKTKAPSKEGGVLGATVFFQDKALYGTSVTEKNAVPTLDHKVVLSDVSTDQKFTVSVIDGNSDIVDNNGRGFEVK